MMARYIGFLPLITRFAPAPAARPGTIDPRVESLVKWMDDALVIPGTNLRFGLDGLLGLIPGVGDLVGLFIGGVVLKEAQRLGASRWVRLRMTWNYAVDFLVGLVPFAGDLFDFAFKAHRKNFQLLQDHLRKRAKNNPPTRTSGEESEPDGNHSSLENLGPNR